MVSMLILPCWLAVQGDLLPQPLGPGRISNNKDDLPALLLCAVLAAVAAHVPGLRSHVSEGWEHQPLYVGTCMQQRTAGPCSQLTFPRCVLDGAHALRKVARHAFGNVSSQCTNIVQSVAAGGADAAKVAEFVRWAIVWQYRWGYLGRCARIPAWNMRLAVPPSGHSHVQVWPQSRFLRRTAGAVCCSWWAMTQRWPPRRQRC